MAVEKVLEYTDNYRRDTGSLDLATAYWAGGLVAVLGRRCKPAFRAGAAVVVEAVEERDGIEQKFCTDLVRGC